MRIETREERIDAAITACSKAVVGLSVNDAMTVAATLVASLCKSIEMQGGPNRRLQARVFVERLIAVMSRLS